MGGAASQYDQPYHIFAWLTFKGVAQENENGELVAPRTSVLASKLLRNLLGEHMMQWLEASHKEFITKQAFICRLILCYEGTTEDRINYMFIMCSIMEGTERVEDAMMSKTDYLAVLKYADDYEPAPQRLYDALIECKLASSGHLICTDYVAWINQQSVLLSYVARRLPYAPIQEATFPETIGGSDQVLDIPDASNASPTSRMEGQQMGRLGSFDFISGEDSVDDSDELYDSEQISDVDDGAGLEKIARPLHTLNVQSTSSLLKSGKRVGRSRVFSADAPQKIVSAKFPGRNMPAAEQEERHVGASAVRRRSGRHRAKMGRFGKAVNGSISRVGNVGRSILQVGKNQHVSQVTTPTGKSSAPMEFDSVTASLMAGGFFSSESRASKSYVCGYLHKVSDGKWSKKSWHRRWFVLDRQLGILSYYRYNPANYMEASPNGNVVQMDDVTDDGQLRSAEKRKRSTRKSRSNTSNSEEAAAVLSEGSGDLTHNAFDNSEAKEEKIKSPRSISKTTPPAVKSDESNVLTSSSTSTPTWNDKPQTLLYMNKAHPWFRGELDLNLESASLLFEKSFARNSPTQFFFQVSSVSLDGIGSKRGIQYKLCADNEAEFDRWTHALSDAINRKHDRKKIASTVLFETILASCDLQRLFDVVPKVSHQQMYRQKLLQQEQTEDAFEMRNSSMDLENEDIRLGHDVPMYEDAEIQQTQQIKRNFKYPQMDSSKDSAHREAQKATYSTKQTKDISRATSSHHTKWRINICIEGQKQCLIAGFIVNIFAVKCFASDEVMSKLFTAFIASIFFFLAAYSPARRRMEELIVFGRYKNFLDPNDSYSFTFAHQNADSERCADASICCLHRKANDMTSSNPGKVHRGKRTSSRRSPKFCTTPTKRVLLGSSVQGVTSLSNGKSVLSHSWGQTNAETFQVRSRDYKKLRRKEPSQSALFEFVGLDLFKTEHKIDHIEEYMEIPEHLASEKLFVLNAQLPGYSPSIWGDGQADGPGYNLVLYWKIPHALHDSSNEAPKSAATRLLHRFLSAISCDNDSLVMDRFKVIAQVTNQNDCGISGVAKKLLTSHNATPVLTRPQHRVHQHENGNIEFIVDLHQFSYIARRGIHLLLDKTSNLVIDIAFVLQGESEEELPEQVIGCCRLDCLDVRRAVPLPR